ncbi:L-type lectin-domain containing receptor kinase IX.1-like [Prosopis cineraria]|uniref:L-type lectin-domain containing receptor kinase IX.1-like n=1 Tax=Prosopis cineraria TaxID=364024 RepID=UPI00240F38B1|nr:L-type lectin-domain containing receptor kinase IX.1-like [Prosopis cineraria]
MMKMLQVTVFFFLLISHAFSLSFNFSGFLSNDDMISYEKSARLDTTSGYIELVSSSGNVGRATYQKPMHLWDKATGKLTDFSSRFAFVIDSQNNTNFGDGMAFFLAPNGSKLPNIPKEAVGGSMGLIIGGNETIFNSTDHPFVAVEFDIYPNVDWDPMNVHVGVDINSIESVSTVIWGDVYDSIMRGRTNEAFISYNSSTHNLSISFTGLLFDNRIVQHHQIVDLRKYLPEWVTFGFSAATGLSVAIHKINTWSFYSEEFSDIAPTPSPNQSPTLSHSQSQTSRNAIAVTTGLGVGGFLLICVVVLFVLWKNKKKMEDDECNRDMSDDFKRGTGPKKYSYAELASAANYFKDEHKLGQGGFGGVFKGYLKDLNSYVAIKRISETSKQGMKEFAAEVRIISHLRHRNLVQLIGWCHERKELLLVYEYMPNGSLSSHLFEDQMLLRWSDRFKIAQGLAHALFYLHEECEQCVVHRDIKPSNIMLDSNFNARLGDFGLARLIDHAKGAQTTALAGTMGYMAPECVTTGRACKESDVYSFGVVSLEIASGRKSINRKAPEDEISIVNWAWQLYGSGRILEAVDSRLEGDFNQDQIKCLMIVGLWCAHPDHNSRPSIRQVIHVLNFEAPFPSLPSSYPMPTYIEYPVWSSFSNLSSTTTSEVVKTIT